MFRKFLVVLFTVLFASGAVLAIIITEVYGTIKDRDFYTEKIAPGGYEILIYGLAESLVEDVFTGLSVEEAADSLKEDISVDDFKTLLGDVYDDLNDAVVEDGELILTISLEGLPEDLIFTFEVGENVEGNLSEYLSEFFKMTMSVVWSFLLLFLALIALVVLKPWYKILRAEINAIFITSLMLSVFALTMFFLPVPELNVFSFVIELMLKDVSARILMYSVPILVLMVVGRIILGRYIKKVDAER